MQFVNWNMLATYAGALAMVMIITQFTKGLKLIEKVPTQVWSYVVALAILYPAYFFTGQLTLETAILILFNAVIVALAANGGYDALNKALGNLLV